MIKSTEQPFDLKNAQRINLKEILRSGYAGKTISGRIVDRRIEKLARPICANTIFAIPEPKPV